MLQAARALQLCGRPLGLGLAPRWLSSSPVPAKIKVGRQEAHCAGCRAQRARARRKQLLPAAAPSKGLRSSSRSAHGVSSSSGLPPPPLPVTIGAGGRLCSALTLGIPIALLPAEPRQSAVCHAPAQQCINALQGEEMLGEPLDVDKAFPQ